MVEKILQEVHFEVHAGQVFCESESAALQAIRTYNNRCRVDKILVEQQRKIEQLQQKQPHLSALEAETQVLRTMLTAWIASRLKQQVDQMVENLK